MHVFHKMDLESGHAPRLDYMYVHKSSIAKEIATYVIIGKHTQLADFI